MKLRNILEHVRYELRVLRNDLANTRVTPTEAAQKAGACCDSLTQALDSLDDDILLRFSISLDCDVEVRTSRKFKSAEEIDFLLEMLTLARSAFDGRADKGVA